MYRHNASGHGFGHPAKKSGNCAKDIGVVEVNWPIGQQAARKDDASKNRTKHQWTNDMSHNMIHAQ